MLNGPERLRQKHKITVIMRVSVALSEGETFTYIRSPPIEQFIACVLFWVFVSL